MKDELRGKFMIKFVGLRAKTYSYLINDGSKDKKVKDKKKGVIKIKLKFEDYKNFLKASQHENKINSIETYAYGTINDLVSEKKIKCNNIRK